MRRFFFFPLATFASSKVLAPDVQQPSFEPLATFCYSIEWKLNSRTAQRSIMVCAVTLERR